MDLFQLKLFSIGTSNIQFLSWRFYEAHTSSYFKFLPFGKFRYKALNETASHLLSKMEPDLNFSSINAKI